MPILFNIHFDVALGADFLDNLAARANDLANFIHRNDDGEHFGAYLRALARLCNRLAHDLVNDVISRRRVFSRPLTISGVRPSIFRSI